jgi:hypothetical protein
MSERFNDQPAGASRPLHAQLPQHVQLALGKPRQRAAGSVPEMRGDGPVIPFSVIGLAIVSSIW